ncbi:MAG: hypothetical protein ACK4S4_15470 [Pyrinomonadaceae bacterium]
MRRFITSVLCVSVFFIGLGALVEKAGAAFRSDEKALAIIAAARKAIGGDAAINNIRSLRVRGSTVKILKIGGEEKSIAGETEIAMQLPDKFSKIVKLGSGGEDRPGDASIDVLVTSDRPSGVGPHKVTIKKGEGGQEIAVKRSDADVKEIETADGGRVIVRSISKDGEPARSRSGDGAKVFVDKRVGDAGRPGPRQDEFARTLLALLLSTPGDAAANFTFGGEHQIDGRQCNMIVADLGSSSVRLYLDRDSNLPVMVAYTAVEPQVVFFRKEAPAGRALGEKKDVVTFDRKADASTTAVEYQVRFSDYRSVDGVQLPYKWVTTVNGAAGETFDVASYEVNPANIADAFGKQRIFVREAKPDQNK